MRLLIDTNIFLEILLGRIQMAACQTLLTSTGQHRFFMTDFSLHSLGLYLFRGARAQVFLMLLSDMVLSNVVDVISLEASDLPQVANNAQLYGLDFDDAYQYTAAELHNLRIVSLDADFERTPQGRELPSNLL